MITYTYTVYTSNNYNNASLKGDPEGVKWELGFALDWENGICVTGTGETDTKMAMGKPMYSSKDNCSWTFRCLNNLEENINITYVCLILKNVKIIYEFFLPILPNYRNFWDIWNQNILPSAIFIITVDLIKWLHNQGRHFKLKTNIRGKLIHNWYFN
jgi:hypothetical protein